MRIASINNYNYFANVNITQKKNKNHQQELNLQNNNINFKGKKWAVAQSVAWAALGFLVAGPAGAIAGAGIGAGVGSQMDDDEPSGDDDNRPYDP